MKIQLLEQMVPISEFRLRSSFRVLTTRRTKFCRFCRSYPNGHCPPNSKEHRSELERIRYHDPNYRARKKAAMARCRAKPEYKAGEKAYYYFFNQQRRQAKSGYIERQHERMVKRFERQKAKQEYQIRCEQWAAERENKRLERQRLITIGKIRPRQRVDKPAELKGLNALDYSHMTVEQRKRWNKWQREIYIERRRERERRWRRQNPEKKAAGNKRWNQLNKEKCRLYRKNPKARIVLNAHHRIRQLCEGLKIESAGVLRGCSSGFFYKYIEEQFYGGMTWENYGKVWELDHMKPVCEFDLSITADRLACANFKNLQPLLVKDNIKKGDRVSF